MKFRKLPPFVLAVFLQFAPVIKLFQANPMFLASSPIAIILRWAVGVAAAVGAYHTVSGASAAIAGMVKYTNSPTGPIPIGLATTNATGVAGQSFFYRILVTNPGVNPDQAFWNVVPLPPGITINTNVGGNGFITNVPGQVTIAGVYPVTLVAGNTLAPPPSQITLPAIITITGGASPPSITTPPANLTVLAGSNATFTVSASGTPPLSYQWRKEANPINGATTATLTIPNAQAADGANYSVQVSNSAGTNISSSAKLTVVDQPVLTLVSSLENQVTLSFTSQPTVSYALQYSTTIPSATWNTLTNFPASSTSNNPAVTDSVAGVVTRYYRLNMGFP